MKKLTSLWLTLLLALGAPTGCTPDTSVGVIGGADGPTQVYVSDEGSTAAAGDPSTAAGEQMGPAVTGTETVLRGSEPIAEDGSYDTRDAVALYLMEYGTLPQNYITKAEAQALGWEGGSLLAYAPGKSIGGDRFGNYEGALPEKDGRTYTECDIDTAGADERGAERIVFSNDGLIFYTADHYQTFTLLLGEEQDEGAAA